MSIGVRSRTVSFRNQAGFRLVADLLVPEGAGPFPCVVFAHGLNSNRHSPRNRTVARRLVGRGIAALMLDFTGHGDSEGTLGDSTIEQQVQDLGAALDFLESQSELDRGRLGANGASSGGTVALLRAAHDPRLRALVLRSPRAYDQAVLQAARLVVAPTLIIVGGADTVVLDEGRALYAELAGDKRLEIIPGAGHLFEGPGEMDRVAELSAEWFAQKL